MNRTIWLALFLLLSLATRGAFAQVHVSPLGSDTSGNGTPALPFYTLGRALQTGALNIYVENGDYIFDAPTVIPVGVTVTGNFYRYQDPTTGAWLYIRSMQPTNFLVNVQTPVFQAFPHPPAFKISSGATLQWVTVKGGYYSVQVEPSGRAFEIDFSGGITAAIYIINSDALSAPGYVDRCRVSGGGYGIQIDKTASAVVTSTVIENALARGIYVAGTGTVRLQNCVVQRSSSQGIFVNANSNVTIQNCVARRNTGAGIYISSASPTIRGCLLEGNSDGIFLGNANAQIQNCTMANNRLNGITVSKGLPALSYNILANNQQFGLAERVQEDVNGQPAPIQTGPMTSNLFWNNSVGAYDDEGTRTLNTVNQINTLAMNIAPPAGTVTADPLFTNSAKSDFRMAKNSPALDISTTEAAFLEDLDGNPRGVDIAAIGGTGTSLVDLGAYETQNSIRTKFATEFADSSVTPDPNHAGQLAAVQTNPRWLFNSSSPFQRLAGKILPGRMRLWSTADSSYGGMGRTLTDDLNQASSQIAIVKATLEADDPSAVALPRIRVNELDKLDVTASFVVLGRRAMAPPFTGREYEFIYDIAQGPYANIPVGTKPTYRQGLSYDLFDFFFFPFHSEHDLTGFSVDFVDRATFNSQFTNTQKFWTFAPTETFEWIPTEAPPGYAQVFLSYDPGRQSLRLEGTSAPSFAGWTSPMIQMPAGKLFKIECRVANGLAQELGPNFRIRMVTKLVDVAYDITCLTFPGGIATPTSGGSLYTMYGRVPNDPALLVGGDKVEMYMAVELFGFAYVPGRDPHAVMFVDDVKVLTAP